MNKTGLLSLSLLVCVSCAHAPCPAPEPCPASSSPAVEAKKEAPAPAGPLVLKGTPEIPAALKARLRQYLNTRRATLMALSPDGQTGLISTRFGRTAQLHLVNRPDGARTQITFNDEPVRAAAFVPGDGRVVTYMSDVGGAEAYQLFRLDLNSGQTTLLTDGKSRHGSFKWSHDGKRLAYTSNARNGRDMDIYLGDGVDPASGKLLLQRQGHWMPMDWSRDGSKLLLGNYRSINDSSLWVLDVATKKVTRVSPEKPTAMYRDAVFDRSGQYIFTATDREGEFSELYRTDLAGKAWKPLTRDLKWNVVQLALSPDGKQLAFAVNEGGYSALRRLHTTSLRHRPVKDTPKGVFSGLSYGGNGRGVIGLSVSGATTAGDVYTHNMRGKEKWKRLTSSEVGGLDPSRFVAPELIQYETFDSRKIPAFYYKPAGAGPHPVLVWIHGGPEGQSRPSFRSVIQYLVLESKVAVLVPNVRGSDGYGKSYLLLDNGFKREDSVKDIGALLDWVKGQKELDAARLGVLGGSYGGYMVLASLVHFADRIVAGVDIVGISNFVTFLTNTKAYRRDLRRAEYGDERDPKMNAHLQKISPSNSADKIRSALFVAHGANDPRVPLSETDQLVEKVQKAGKEAWYMVAMNEGHGFRKKENRDAFWQLTILFFEKYLK